MVAIVIAPHRVLAIKLKIESIERNSPPNREGVHRRDRWLWFEQLWSDACELHSWYRLALRSGWWEHQFQVETLAALAAWGEQYDSGESDDPPGKLALLCDLERVAQLLRIAQVAGISDRPAQAVALHGSVVPVTSLRTSIQRMLLTPRRFTGQHRFRGAKHPLVQLWRTQESARTRRRLPDRFP
jgi:hypothetical protein